ncbi:MAG: GrpB family protein, partial [Chloroflexota bacterium]|nr:GrpB family protein [Chloroflexota bacterium]
MLAAHVGPLTPLNGPVILADYDPTWPEQYAAEARKICHALGTQARLVKHVGSTSVPGLPAKPLLDILLLVSDSADEAGYVPALEAAGYRLHIREPEWYQHRLLKGDTPAVNLHVFSLGCEEAARMLLFRDWLRAHDDERDLYAATKRKLAAQTWRYTQNYADAKSEVVRAILTRALAAQE